MAIPTINGVVQVSNTTTPVTATAYAPTVGANAKLIALPFTEHGANDSDITSVTYDGNNLTEVVGVSSGDLNHSTGIWYLDDPRSFAVSGNVVANGSGTDPNMGMTVLTLLGAAAGTPLIFASSTSGAYPESVNINTGGTDRLVLSNFSIDGTGSLDVFSPSSPAGHSTIGSIINPTGSGHVQGAAGSSSHATGESITITWSKDSGANVIVSINLVAAVFLGVAGLDLAHAQNTHIAVEEGLLVY